MLQEARVRKMLRLQILLNLPCNSPSFLIVNYDTILPYPKQGQRYIKWIKKVQKLICTILM